MEKISLVKYLLNCTEKETQNWTECLYITFKEYGLILKYDTSSVNKCKVLEKQESNRQKQTYFKET